MTARSPNKKQKGQVLLITVMLLATALTVALSVSFKSTTETQVTKLEEESQKALAAAEAGIEEALKSGTADIGSLSGLGSFSGTAQCSETSPGQEFVTPLLQKDEQYTFYFADYDQTTNSFSNYWSGGFDLYFQTESNTPAIELTFITNSDIYHYLLDPDNLIPAPPATGKTAVTSGSYPLKGNTFSYKTQSSFNLSGDTKIIIARVLDTETKIGISASSNLKPQGKTCESSATSGTTAGEGATKKVSLFQSYPQIPVDFFVTSF